MSARIRTARLVFAGGGTGGHLFPALAIADRLKEMLGGKAEIVFIGTKRGLEYRLRETLGYPLHTINVRGLARSLTLKNLLVPFLFLGALFRSGMFLDQFKPDLVVGTGGYVSLPVLKMAAAKNIPTVIQEQNSYPGLSTRKAAGKAQRVYLGFSGAQKHLKTSAQVIVTGNPVRSELTRGNRVESLKSFGLDLDKKTILILGGSQGARALNKAILDSLMSGELPEEYQLLWQTGKGDYTDVIATAGDMVQNHALFPFENRMAQVLAAADLAISRAGALTIAELQACGVPAILVPYPHAAGDHQRQNASDCADDGCAVMIEQHELAQSDLLKKAVELFCSGRVDQMQESIQMVNSTRRAAVDVIADDIVALLKKNSNREDEVDE
ncbi:MAG: undecaprenyldiphospho-muramoylpentapeptide beta-N-acetylglucosaminyltransferase [Candidatus Zixiibacteriota bacterium]|nr:MAG: undecaprenyldiphospho-muramoylpentapeptide beta-N-acetylglucosaminyltransferase [candidate division Zixibacteria bacterium]